MAGSSPAMTFEFGTVPALRSGMKNAAPRPGHGPSKPRDAAMQVIFVRALDLGGDDLADLQWAPA
jgi:hypothetical protein